MNENVSSPTGRRSSAQRLSSPERRSPKQQQSENASPPAGRRSSTQRLSSPDRRSPTLYSRHESPSSSPERFSPLTTGGKFDAQQRTKWASRSFQFDYGLTVDPHSVAYRYHKTRPGTVLSKTNVPQQDTLIGSPSAAPPVGTYDLPTFPPELKPFDRKPSSPFKSAGRLTQFVDNSTMFYRCNRDDVALTNIGPGSYNLAYSWRTDEHNYSHLRTIATAPGGNQRHSPNTQWSPNSSGGSGSPTHFTGSPSSPSNTGTNVVIGNKYPRLWQLPKQTKTLLSPRTLQENEWNIRQDLATIQNLPKYPPV